MSALAIDYRYRYPFPSQVSAPAAGPQLSLATFTDDQTSPYFYEGRLRQPYLTARLLQCLWSLVRTRFFQQIEPKTFDPIVTSHGDFVRFEVFSGCCSVYARLDLPPESLAGQTHGRGTTNVDFNPAMLAALAKVRKNDELNLAVGTDGIQLEHQGHAVVEKKVKLPIRWLKGLVAVTGYSKVLHCRHQVDPVQAARFLKSLPRGSDNRTRWQVVAAGKGLRLGTRASVHSVEVSAVNRLRVLEESVAAARSLRVYGGAVEASGWELDFGDLRFSMIMTHDVWRGFSGEGQGLESLARPPVDTILKPVQANLNWQAILPRTSGYGLSDQDYVSGLDFLAAKGQVGFDVHAGHYYHRQLPFDMDYVSGLQPRFKAAQKLIEEKAVRLVKELACRREFEVRSNDVTHYVILDAELWKCTCPWYAKHQMNRGPCKHVLASQMLDSQ